VRRLCTRGPSQLTLSERQTGGEQAASISTTSEIGQSQGSSLLVVQVQPLDPERVRKFVEKRGVKNGDAFIDAINRNYAWEFVRRPVDVVDLIGYWLSRGSLGSLSQMMSHDVRLKLEPSNRDKADPLSSEEAQAGGRSLAASTTFCRRLTFKVPDDSFVVPNAIDASVVLPSAWRADQVKALLTRPIFDGASYGRIRFHHRRVNTSAFQSP
jgi:hypothetical protein